MPCRYLRCPQEVAYVVRRQGDLLEVCADHAADGVAVGRWDGLAPIEACQVRGDGIVRRGDFLLEEAATG